MGPGPGGSFLFELGSADRHTTTLLLNVPLAEIWATAFPAWASVALFLGEIPSRR